MSRRLRTGCVLMLTGWLSAAEPGGPRYLQPDLPAETRARDLVARLDAPTKLRLLSTGVGALDRPVIPACPYGNDAIHGLARPGRATLFPCPLLQAATFDPALVERLGDTVADEARAVNNAGRGPDATPAPNTWPLLLLTPCLSPTRDPRSGGALERYGEDPLLAARIGGAYLRGLRGSHPRWAKALGVPRGGYGRDREEHRFGANVRIPESLRREYYLAPWDAVLREHQAGAVIAGLHAINGTPCVADRTVLTHLLRRDWGFAGPVVAEEGAVAHQGFGHKTAPHRAASAGTALSAGVDVEWPFDTFQELPAAQAQRLAFQTDIDAAVVRALLPRFELGLFEPAGSLPHHRISPVIAASPLHGQLARQAARSGLVLLKNAPAGPAPLLPLDRKRVRRLLLVGPDAQRCRFAPLSGDPSGPSPTPETVFETRWGATNVTVFPWADTPAGGAPFVTVPPDRLLPLNGEGAGLTGMYFDRPEPTGEPGLTRVDRFLRFDWMRGDVWPLPHDRRKRPGRSARWSGRLVPGVGGDYQFALWADDQAKLTIAGKTLVAAGPRTTITPAPPSRRTGVITLEAGRPVPVSVEYADTWRESELRLEWLPPGAAAADALERAARNADAVIAWLGPEVPAGRDRTTSALPPDQEAFLQRVVAANPNTILVLQGATVSCPWAAARVPAIVQAWYPGEYGAEAIADLLCGDIAPSGRLPVSIPADDKHLPPLDDHDITRGATYLWSTNAPLHPFGHGLTYTTFAYTNFTAGPGTARIPDTVMVKGEIVNTGPRDADEVVQVYVRDVESTVPRPARQLRAFRRVTVPAGKSVTVELPLRVADWRFWDTKQLHWAFETGDFEIQVGASSADIRWTGTVRVR